MRKFPDFEEMNGTSMFAKLHIFTPQNDTYVFNSLKNIIRYIEEILVAKKYNPAHQENPCKVSLLKN